ncbi:GguC protein [Pelistega indica]|uniref:GguC protein n=1 Tax=Pelistega indica TaxID=1414851 RepID=V8FVY6_9BURK|nr:AraD1 family protein [Pelistega indica]ETD68026.1 GguC protein [Pelistega indica]
MRLVSLKVKNKSRTAVVENENSLRLIDFDGSTYNLLKELVFDGEDIESYISKRLTDDIINYADAIEQGCIEIPMMHPDEAHCLVSGTGLTHMGSADTRNAMHAKLNEDNLSDSMKMFKRGMEGGKPQDGELGAEPEWFYKGDGSIVVPPYQSLPVPSFAEDAGEEPEIVGLYIINKARVPIRIGFCIGNEFSDHVKEKQNYLLLAHSKLRPCSIGPEILVGELPKDLTGVSKIVRNGNVVWEKTFLTGEDNMVHSIANLEKHHFKYEQFCKPGDMHIHFFGTSTLSFADGIKTQDGDVFEISIPEFGKALVNSIDYQSN